jgi:hypothetical protein
VFDETFEYVKKNSGIDNPIENREAVTELRE